MELEWQAEAAKVRCDSANFSNSEERISPVTFAVIENGSLTSIKFVPISLEEKESVLTIPKWQSPRSMKFKHALTAYASTVVSSSR